MLGEISLSKIFSKDQGLYTISLGEKVVVFKALTLSQKKTVERILFNFPSLKESLEEEIWDKCVLKHDFLVEDDALPAGVMSTVVDTIYRISSPISSNEILEDIKSGRNELMDAREQAILFVCKAFPAYTPEMLEEMEWSTIVKRIAQSEIILQTVLDFSPPEEQKNEMIKTVDGIDYLDLSKATAELAEV